MAKQIPGNMPEVRPLQPAPVGIEPDISHNTNNVTNEAVLPEGVTVNRDQDGQTEIVTAPDQSGVFAQPAGPAVATQWMWVLGILIIVAIGLLVVWRYSAGKRQSDRKTEDTE